MSCMACKHHGCDFAEEKLCASAVVVVVRVPLWDGCAGVEREALM